MNEFLRVYGRKLLLWIVGSAIAIGMLLVVSIPGQHNREMQARALLKAQQEAAAATRALACVLTLPVTEQGRSEILVAFCFTQYGLEPPSAPGGDE